MVGIIQCVLSVVALAVAWLIPKKIRWEQTYENLSDEYRGYDYAAAVQGIVEFFIIKCKSDTSKIKEMYERRFLKDVYGVDFSSASVKKMTTMQIFEEIKSKLNTPAFCKEELISDNSKKLHFQRRLLAQFFCELDLCAKSPFIRKRRVSKDYTSRESDIIKILILIDDAVLDSPILMKDIFSNEIIKSEKHYKGMNKYLSHIYSILKKSKKYMEV